MQYFSTLFGKELYMSNSSMANKQNKRINIRTRKNKTV